jgi:hypothetical protein
MPDGRNPSPGGWNRIEFVVDDIAAEVERLRAEGVRFRNDIVTGPGGKQILIEDPSGNPIELFQPAGVAADVAEPNGREPHLRRSRSASLTARPTKSGSRASPTTA